ncbi:MAG: hypothetical protein H6668_16320 [Ardenticatenaceae bacterium]|nr:hypothetical protein [Ardenticatenaceae bacterium]
MFSLALLLLLYRIAQAVCGGGNLGDFCSSNFGLSSDLTAMGITSNSLPAVNSNRLPVAGCALLCRL